MKQKLAPKLSENHLVQTDSKNAIFCRDFILFYYIRGGIFIGNSLEFENEK